MSDAVTMDKIVSLARRRNLLPSSEIYGGLGSSYDYGHYGVLLKENVKHAGWRRWCASGTTSSPSTPRSSCTQPWRPGHVTGFADPLVDCRFCKRRYRADQLEEAECGARPSKHPGETDKCDLTEPRQFNLMFQTRIGPVEETGQDAYLRPETAQGIFVNFKNVAQIARRKPPFGIAQIGKAFRNEITPGNFIFRTLEFEQMEMEYFVPPAEAEEWFRFWVEERRSWHLRYGIRESHLRARARRGGAVAFRAPRRTSSTCSRWGGPSSRESRIAATSTCAPTPKPLGRSSSGSTARSATRRTSSSRRSGQPVDARVLVDAYDEEVVAERERTVLRLHPALAPVKVAVLPLIPRNEDMVAKARSLYESFGAWWWPNTTTGQIGRRYRRQDEIGTPYALTIDDQTLEDDTVTIRDRDSLEQERIRSQAPQPCRDRRRGLENAEGLAAPPPSAFSPGSANPNLR